MGKCEIVCHQWTFEIQINWDHWSWEVRKEGAERTVLKGNLMTGTLSSGAYVTTVCYDRSTQRVNSLDIH